MSASLLLRDYSASLNTGEQPNSNPFRGDTMAPLLLRGLALPLSRQNHFRKSSRNHFEVISKSFALPCPCGVISKPFRKSFRNHLPLMAAPYRHLFEIIFEIISKSFPLPRPCGAPRRCPPLCHTPRDPVDTSGGGHAEGSFRSRNKVSVGDSSTQRILRAKNPIPR